MFAGIKVSVERLKDFKTVLYIDGKLDSLAAPVLDRYILTEFKEGYSHIVLDFSSVDYLSSAAIRVLLANSKKLKTHNGNLHLCCLQDTVLNVLRISGFHQIFRIFHSGKSALEAF